MMDTLCESMTCRHTRCDSLSLKGRQRRREAGVWGTDSEGWGSRVIDRLSLDLGRAFPKMTGLSARNLKYMRAFAEAWPDREFVQQVVAQLPWGHNIRLLDAVKTPSERT